MPTTRILIVDDSLNVRRRLRANLELNTELQICGEAADGLEAIDAAVILRPDLIILDLCMPRMNGIDAAAALHRILPLTPIVLFTLHEDIISESLIRESGISSVVSKMGAINVLISEVQRLIANAQSASA